MTVDERARDAGYDDLLDALEDGEGYYLECASGHGWLPPRATCPTCGSRDLGRCPLPATGEVVAHTTVHVAAPAFAEDTPYVVALVDVGPVTLTGQVRGLDPEAVTAGTTVAPTVVESETADERLLGFEPR